MNFFFFGALPLSRVKIIKTENSSLFPDHFETCKNICETFLKMYWGQVWHRRNEEKKSNANCK